MGIINPTLPSVNSPRGDEEIDARNALATVLAEFNGNVDAANLKNNSVTKAKAGSDLLADLLPTGAMLEYPGISAPAGYLVCDGTAVARGTYPNLFAALCLQTTGTTASGSPSVTAIPSTALMVAGMPISGPGIPVGATILTVNSAVAITLSANATASAAGVALVVAPHGVGDGVTTFNVPDMRGRAPIGVGTGAGLTARVNGAGSGEESHLLTDAETLAGTLSGADHLRGFFADVAQQVAGTRLWYSGNSQAHNNMQPWRAVNYIVRHGN